MPRLGALASSGLLLAACSSSQEAPLPPATIQAAAPAVAPASPVPTAPAVTSPVSSPPVSPAPALNQVPARRAAAPAPSAAGPPATAPPPVAAPAPPAMRSFEPGRTVVESLRPIGRDLDNFDTRGMLVRRAPEVKGRIDFEVQPARVAPGQPYTVKVYLTNDGGKEIKVDDVGVVIFSDDQRSTRSVKARTNKAEPSQRILLAELPEQGGASFWAVEVTVISKRKDVYRNTLLSRRSQ